MKRTWVCGVCKKDVSGLAYTRRLQDGREVKMCFRCSDKQIKQQVELQKLAQWNEWVKR